MLLACDIGGIPGIPGNPPPNPGGIADEADDTTGGAAVGLLAALLGLTLGGLLRGLSLPPPPPWLFTLGLLSRLFADGGLRSALDLPPLWAIVVLPSRSLTIVISLSCCWCCRSSCLSIWSADQDGAGRVMSSALDGLWSSLLTSEEDGVELAEGHDRLRSSEDRGLLRTGERELSRRCWDDVDDDGEGEANAAVVPLR
jgi:hypothetical protein